VDVVSGESVALVGGGEERKAEARQSVEVVLGVAFVVVAESQRGSERVE
jgi:hypothetical protein